MERTLEFAKEDGMFFQSFIIFQLPCTRLTQRSLLQARDGKPCLAERDFTAKSPTLSPDGRDTTAYTAAEVPLPLASPKQCNSMLLILFRYLGRETGM